LLDPAPQVLGLGLNQYQASDSLGALCRQQIA
jgi:hypothetical protein